jgi:hypothetical protein
MYRKGHDERTYGLISLAVSAELRCDLRVHNAAIGKANTANDERQLVGQGGNLQPIRP